MPVNMPFLYETIKPKRFKKIVNMNYPLGRVVDFWNVLAKTTYFFFFFFL